MGLDKSLELLKKHWWIIALVGAGFWQTAGLYFEFRDTQREVARLKVMVEAIYYVPRNPANMGGTP